MNPTDDQPLETLVPRLSPSARTVYKALAEHGPMTDDEIVIKTGIKKGTASPRRGDLVKAGLVERDRIIKTESGTKAQRWALVPEHRISEAREKAATKGPRRKPVSDYTLDERVDAVRQLLDMDDVNAAIQSKNGRAWSRARGRRQDHRSERERMRRQNEAALREAERRGSPQAEYYKLRRVLIESSERVRAVRRLVDEELDRRYLPGGQAIPIASWPDVVDLLGDLEQEASDCISRIQTVMGVLGDDVIEGTVVDVQDFMQLLEGDAEAG